MRASTSVDLSSRLASDVFFGARFLIAVNIGDVVGQILTNFWPTREAAQPPTNAPVGRRFSAVCIDDREQEPALPDRRGGGCAVDFVAAIPALDRRGVHRQ